MTGAPGNGVQPTALDSAWAIDATRGPRPFAWQGRGGLPWRVFFTQQHGDNHTWELVPRL